jgi:hypothetical protein
VQHVGLERAPLRLALQPLERRMRTMAAVPPGERLMRRSSSWRGGSQSCDKRTSVGAPGSLA